MYDDIQSLFCDQSLETGIFFFKLMKPPRFGYSHVAAPLPPFAKGGVRDSVLPTSFNDLHARLACFKTPMSCSSVNLLFFILLLLRQIS